MHVVVERRAEAVAGEMPPSLGRAHVSVLAAGLTPEAVIRSTKERSPKSFEQSETREQADGRGILASEKVESTITATTTIASEADDTKFVIRAVERGEYGASTVDLTDVFSNLKESNPAQDGKHVLKCREAEVEVEREADKVIVRQRGKKWSFTIRPVEDREKAGVTGSQSGNVEQSNAADSR